MGHLAALANVNENRLQKKLESLKPRQWIQRIKVKGQLARATEARKNAEAEVAHFKNSNPDFCRFYQEAKKAPQQFWPEGGPHFKNALCAVERSEQKRLEDFVAAHQPPEMDMKLDYNDKKPKSKASTIRGHQHKKTGRVVA